MSWHAAGVGLSGALSFLVAGVISDLAGWRWAFGTAGICTVGAFIIVAVTISGQAPTAAEPREARPALLDFRPVLRNRSALAYSLGYGAHAWELFALRSWGVTFLTFTAVSLGGGEGLMAPTAVAFLMGVLATWASVGGNELCIRLGRQRMIVAVMVASMAAAVVIGYTSAIAYGAAVAACLIYNILIYLDSSALTAGTSGSAEPGRRGSTLAVHSTIGYIGGFLGPLAIGVILDLVGGESVGGWMIAFGHLAVVGAVGVVALSYLKPRDLPGDKPVHPRN